MKSLCKLLGGSYSYGLATPTSDLDYRGVYMHDDSSYIVGLKKHDHEMSIKGGDDVVEQELRHFMSLLKKTNTNSMEILFTPKDKFISLHPMFDELILQNRWRLVDTKKFYSSIKGYIQHERKLANGELSGELGLKRKEAIIKYGYSPKNFINLFRLTLAAKRFFNDEDFPVHIESSLGKEVQDKLYHMKTQPENYKKEQLTEESYVLEADMDKTYANMYPEWIRTFDDKLAEDIIMAFYFPMLCSIYGKKSGY